MSKEEVTVTYTIYKNPDNEYVETVRITATDEIECDVQVEEYLDTKVNCYAVEVE